MINQAKADAMLCVWKEQAKEKEMIIPEFPMFVEYTCVVFKKDKMKKRNTLNALTGKRQYGFGGMIIIQLRS